MDQGNATFKGATRELTLDRVAHAPNLGCHNQLSTKRLTTACDAPMRVYPAAATIRPRFGCKTLVFRSLRPEAGFLEIKARRRVDIKEPQTPLTAARSTGTARATITRAHVGATRGQVYHARHRHNYPRRAFRIRDFTTGQVIMRQVTIWHPTAEEAVFSDTATKGRGGGATRALFAATQDNLPLHVLTGEPGSRFEGVRIRTAWTEEGGWVGRCI